MSRARSVARDVAIGLGLGLFGGFWIGALVILGVLDLVYASAAR